jgi:hypothetical protein
MMSIRDAIDYLTHRVPNSKCVLNYHMRQGPFDIRAIKAVDCIASTLSHGFHCSLLDQMIDGRICNLIIFLLVELYSKD